MSLRKHNHTMDSWTSQQETITSVQNYTPVYVEADYPELMRDELWTRVDCNHPSGVNDYAPYAHESS
ncbi:unnamed protein product [Taenia asiatica]|uniref:Methyltransferase n=1 Tax=Taenia asiatica TaxID=60517 RepID=A0A0R3WAU3_TAEAS|nr:unnamed protein product [Taenia asiatica]